MSHISKHKANIHTHIPVDHFFGISFNEAWVTYVRVPAPAEPPKRTARTQHFTTRQSIAHVRHSWSFSAARQESWLLWRYTPRVQSPAQTEIALETEGPGPLMSIHRAFSSHTCVFTAGHVVGADADDEEASTLSVCFLDIFCSSKRFSVSFTLSIALAPQSKTRRLPAMCGMRAVLERTHSRNRAVEERPRGRTPRS